MVINSNDAATGLLQRLVAVLAVVSVGIWAIGGCGGGDSTPRTGGSKGTGTGGSASGGNGSATANGGSSATNGGGNGSATGGNGSATRGGSGSDGSASGGDGSGSGADGGSGVGSGSGGNSGTGSGGMTADAGGGDAGNGPGDGRTQYDCCEPTGSTECTDDGKFRECRPTTRARCPTGGRWSQPKSCPGDDEICAESASSSQGCTEKTPCNTDNNNCSPRASCQVDSTADDGYRCVCDKKGDGRFCYSDELYTRIDAGTFEMGSPSGETGRESDETQHTVQIDHSFLMRTQEARQPDWEGSNQPWTKTSVSCSSSNIPCPIFNVSWYDALFHANQLSKRHGFETCYDLSNCSGTPGEDYTCSSVSFEGVDCRGYRLPTEAEWEYAMRAGTTTATYEGELDPDANYSKLKDIAWFQANSGGQPHPFESREANDRGLYNGLGNVAEWVWDRYGSHPSRPVTDPTGPSNGMARVVRGGHWDSPAAACRAAARAKETPDTRNGKIGFRLVRTLIK